MPSKPPPSARVLTPVGAPLAPPALPAGWEPPPGGFAPKAFAFIPPSVEPPKVEFRNPVPFLLYQFFGSNYLKKTAAYMGLPVARIGSYCRTGKAYRKAPLQFYLQLPLNLDKIKAGIRASEEAQIASAIEKIKLQTQYRLEQLARADRLRKALIADRRGGATDAQGLYIRQFQTSRKRVQKADKKPLPKMLKLPDFEKLGILPPLDPLFPAPARRGPTKK